MSVFEIVIGPMRAGKTTYAQGTGKTFLSFDKMMEICHYDVDRFHRAVTERLILNPNTDFIVDGWFSKFNNSADSILDLNIPHETKVTAFYAPLADLLYRAGSLDHDARQWQTPERIKPVYDTILAFYGGELADVPFEFRCQKGEMAPYDYSMAVREDFCAATPDDIVVFKTRLQRRTHDLHYQTIYLPHGMTIPSRDEETGAVMQQIADAVEFRGATVLDVGCYHCGQWVNE